MRKNRKVTKKMSVVAGTTMHVAAVVVILFAMVILNLLASSSCSQLMKEIGVKEKLYSKLEDECTQELTNWQKMTTPDRLEEMLLRHGLAMRAPRPDQWVRMKSNGQPFPGQMSVARATGRSTAATASVRKATRRR